jgi:hypothetical protein
MGREENMPPDRSMVRRLGSALMEGFDIVEALDHQRSQDHSLIQRVVWVLQREHL